jgi:hypothetical protein
MDEEQEQRVREMVWELDAIVPRDGAQVRMVQYGGGPDESRMVGTRRGYLRLGIELIKAALAKPVQAGGQGDDRLGVDLDYLTVPGSDVRFDEFLLSQDPARDAVNDKPGIDDRLWGIGCVAALLLVTALLLVGLGTIAHWIFH